MLGIRLVIVLLFASLSYGHHESYEPEIIKVADGVYVAVNYALANMIAVEGPDGLLIIDCTENQMLAVNLTEQFRAMTNNKPVKGIVLTHHHTDHIVGASALLALYQNENNTIEVFAHSSHIAESNRMISQFRNFAQFGASLPPGEHGDGIGPDVIPDYSVSILPAYPTKVFDTRATFNCAGLSFELIHIPGETNDQIAVWFPDRKIIMPGDNIYEAFPNLYAIRGTAARNVKDWFNSLDIMRYLYAEYVVPSHSRPFNGKDNIFSIFTAYRDGIQFVHDQTFKLMERDYYVDDIVEQVKLPDSLATHPYLIEYYGTVAWSVRHVFSFYLGWFSGNAVELNPLTIKERSFRISELLKYPRNPFSTTCNPMLLSASFSIAKSDLHESIFKKPLIKELQWALEVSDMALHVASAVDVDKAKEMKQKALLKMGDAQISANGYNYYYVSEQEMAGGLEIPSILRELQERKKDINFFMDSFTHRINVDKCNETQVISVMLNLITPQHPAPSSFGYIARHCVVEFQTEYLGLMGPFDVIVTTQEDVWRNIVLDALPLDYAYQQGYLNVQGSFQSLQDFMNLMDPFYF